MASGVQVDGNVVLRLILGQDCSGSDRELARLSQVLDGDIEMHLHLLISPGWEATRRRGLFSVWKDRPGPPSRERSFTQPGSSCSVSQPSRLR